MSLIVVCKTKLYEIYYTNVEGLRLTTACNCYKKGEKSTKFILTLERRHAIQNQVKTLVVNDEVVKEQTEIKKNLYFFYIKSFFPKITTFLDKRYCNIYKTKTLEIEWRSMCYLPERHIRKRGKTWIEQNGN